MNFRRVFKTTGRVLLVEALAMLAPLAVAVYYEETILPFVYAILLAAGFGALMTLMPADDRFYAREGFFTVGLLWVLMGVFGAFPFFFSGYFEGFIDCVFESISGFTTTGASIQESIEHMSKSILFWRCETQWLGGMGILVLTVALLPSLGENGKYLMRAETPGPLKTKLVPKSAKSSQILYTIYCALSIVQACVLRLCGLSWYHAVTVSMATAATGGFSVLDSSIAGYNNIGVEYVVTIFMLLFSINFGLYFMGVTGRIRQAIKSDEMKWFLGVFLFATITIAINIYSVHDSLEHTIRIAAFQTASILSTTGFATANFDIWPWYSKTLLVLMMCCGGCAGSTAGGIKWSRIMICVRRVRREIREIVHPNSVNVVKVDGQVIEEKTINTTLVFFCAYIGIFMAGILLLSIENVDFITTVTAVITCLSNVGPGLALVGPICTFNVFSAFGKLLLSLIMIIGRLEVFPILILFSRSAWRTY